MSRLASVSLLSLLLAGCGESSTAATTGDKAVDKSSEPLPVEPTPPTEPPAAEPEPEPKPEPAAVALPKAEDVLPAAEVSPGSLVVSGDGFRFQIPPGFEPATVEGAVVAYAGDIQGMNGPARLTLSVSKQPFDGNDEALADQIIEQLTAAGGSGRKMPGLMQVAGTAEKLSRVHGKTADGDRLYVMKVHEGHGYVLVCDIAPPDNGWVNAGSDCMIRGTTFHVAPPP